MASSASDVLNAAAKRRIDPVKGLEPWGLSLFLRSMTERELTEYEFGIMDPDTGKTVPSKLKQSRARLITRAVCDEKGTLIFTEEQVQSLMQRDGKLVALLNRQARDHVGLNKEEKKADSDSTNDDELESDSASKPEGST